MPAAGEHPLFNLLRGPCASPPTATVRTRLKCMFKPAGAPVHIDRPGK
jgi:hypothetical protein